MKRKEIKIEQVMRLPEGSLKEMDQALDRILDRLRCNADLNHDRMHEKPTAYSSPYKTVPVRRIAALLAAALVIAVAWIGIDWQKRYGTLESPDGERRWVFQGVTFGAGGGTLTLQDGSGVEIREMSELSLEPTADGIRILLSTGSIIVNAAKQRDRHLYVQTKDMTVSVVGTVFVVKAEESGSRVAVVEGKVEVRQGATEKELLAGEYAATYPAKEPPSVREEISWSRHAEEHMALLATAQRQARPQFEIADVHWSPARADGREVVMSGGGPVRGGRYEIYNATLLDLIRTAYGVDAEAIIGGPTWLGVDRFDVIAKAPENTTPALITLMLQSLLAGRFGLVARNDTRPMPAWVLSKGSGQPKLKRPTTPDESGCRGVYEIDRLSCRNVTMDAFVAWLRSAPRATRPVLNSTGLEGSWDFDLDGLSSNFMRGVSENSPIPQAVDKQLGLKLALQSISQPVIVVESVNRAPSANVPGVETRLPPDPVEFEVASIRPCETVEPRGWRISPSGQATTGCQTLRMHIVRAWDLGPRQDTSNGFRDIAFGGTKIDGAPRWLDSKRFNIVAKAPIPIVGVAGDAKYTAMLRNLLVDRFKMVTRYEDRLTDVYTLVAAAPRLEKANPSGRTGCRSSGLVPVSRNEATTGYSQVITCQNATIAHFVEALNKTAAVSSTGRRIVDETGIEGAWDLTFTFRYMRPSVTAPGEAPDPAGSIPVDQAVEQQLGLKLREAKRPIRVFVIDHIEESPTEN